MFALTSKPAVAAAKVRLVSDRKKISAHAHRAASVPRRGFAVTVKATADDKNGPSRRDILSAPGLAALLSAAVPAEQLWLPGVASAKKGGIKPTNVTGFDDSIAAAKLGPIGGAVPCSDYKAWEKTIYGFINGIKTGECPPAFKNATRGFLLKQDGIPAGQDPLVMFTPLIPEADQKAGLAFFVNKGPKANPLWATDDIKAFTTLDPFTVTASTAKFIRGVPPKSVKGLWFGQYNLGWNGAFDDWAPAFTSPEADAFHNSLGVVFSVAHQMNLKDPGNTYKPKAKIGIEVFHCFNSLEGAQELGKAFNPESPFFKDEPRYVGPYDATIWKIVDDIDYTA
tara:strand:+ start:177 stop:1193 length:1017 start_codon:yes stop_codon:yes gene_type:complete